MGLFPEWTWIVALFIGAAIGSFLNVVIYRMPRGLSLNEPKNSFCPSCQNRLTTPDLFPLLSWLILRGKCRHCQKPIPSRYFWVELITGSLFALFWYQNLVDGNDVFRCAVLCAMSACLVAATFIDLRYYIIPDQINACLLFFGLVYNGALIATHHPKAFTWGVPSAMAGALVGIGVLWGITLLGRLIFQKDAMGHGDIKLARGIGAILFPAGALYSFAMAICAGAVIGIFQIMLRKRGTETDAVEESEEIYEPESIASIFKCGLGYVLLVDVVGLFVPKVYQSWFGEDPYSVEEITEEEDVGDTMIPFGPYLAAGAILAATLEPQLNVLVQRYIDSVTGG